MYWKTLYSKISRIKGLNSCWESIRHLGTTHFFEQDQIIDVTLLKGFFYIHSGRVKVTYLENNGQDLTLLIAESGSILNIVTQLVADSKPPLLTCLERTELVVFDGSMLNDPDFISRHPEQIISLLSSLAVHLEIHSRQLNNSSMLTSLSYLCRIFMDIYNQGNGDAILDPDMTQQELAGLLGVNRTTLTRNLHRLRRMGIIGSYTKHRLIINDPIRLKKLADHC